MMRTIKTTSIILALAIAALFSVAPVLGVAQSARKPGVTEVLRITQSRVTIAVDSYVALSPETQYQYAESIQLYGAEISFEAPATAVTCWLCNSMTAAPPANCPVLLTPEFSQTSAYRSYAFDPPWFHRPDLQAKIPVICKTANAIAQVTVTLIAGSVGKQ